MVIRRIKCYLLLVFKRVKVGSINGHFVKDADDISIYPHVFGHEKNNGDHEVYVDSTLGRQKCLTP